MFYHKKQNSRNKIFTAGALVVSLAFGFVGYYYVHGDAATDALASQKQAAQAKLDAVNKKIADLNSQINATQKQANTLSNQIKLIDLQIASTEAEINATEDKIDQANLEIADVTDKIAKTQADIVTQKGILKSLIGQINDLDQRSPFEIALENDNFTDFLNDLQYATSIQERSQEALTEIKKLQADLESRQSQLKKQKDDLDVLDKQLTVQKQGLDGQRQNKQSLLTQTKGQEKKYQQLLTDSQKEQGQINQEINDLEAQIAARLGNNKTPAIKGLFSWPMKGTVTQGYGNTGFTSLGYTFHNGLDIASAAGTPIYAAADGVVLDNGYGDKAAYGNWVTIKHEIPSKYGNHALVTLYGHMSSYVLKKGQTVKEGDLVGFEGNTGNTTALLYGPHRGYHLHFTVFDFNGYGVTEKSSKTLGNYRLPYGATYNPLNYL